VVEVGVVVVVEVVVGIKVEVEVVVWVEAEVVAEVWVRGDAGIEVGVWVILERTYHEEVGDGRRGGRRRACQAYGA